MGDDVYRKLAKVLDTLPNGFPETESGIEIKILKKIFDPDQAELFCDLKLNYETPEAIASRTGRPLDSLTELLTRMWERGQIFGVDLGGVKLFKMIPWVVGIYEYQIKHLTRELSEMIAEYMPVFGKQFFNHRPHPLQVVPVEQEIENLQEAMPYERVSAILKKGKSFGVNECICKKERGLLGNECSRPLHVCLAIAPVEGVFEDHPLGMKSITKEDAIEILRIAEENGLVHLASNFENNQFFICNCCSCCCGVLRAINEYGVSEAINSAYYAKIESDICIACGICADERCQINAISIIDGIYTVLEDKCIGCGLCVSTCGVSAISLIRKKPEDIVKPAKDEAEWYLSRSAARGVDIGKYM